MKHSDPNGPDAARLRRKQTHIPTWGASVWCDDCGDWITEGFVQAFFEAGLQTLVTPDIWPVNLNWLTDEHNKLYKGHHAHVVVSDIS